MTDSEGRSITFTGGGLRRKPAKVGKLFDRRLSADGLVIGVNVPSPAPVRIAPTTVRPGRAPWPGRNYALARKIKNEYDGCQTDAEKVQRFGANRYGKPSLTKAFEWACEHYERPDGTSYNAKLLAQGLYQRG